MFLCVILLDNTLAYFWFLTLANLHTFWKKENFLPNGA